MRNIDGTERDSTQDWIVPRGAVPTVGELEARIDEALVIARASEEGVREVGEMALDAARQARKAAEMAEASAVAAKEAAQASSGLAGPVTDLVPPPAAKAVQTPIPAGPVSDGTPPPSGDGPPSSPPAGEAAEEQLPREVVIDPLQRFNERADRVAARLKKLERVPV